VSIFVNSKLGESQGRKTTGLMFNYYDRRVAKEFTDKLYALADSFFILNKT